jgi:hypothetical protein
MLLRVLRLQITDTLSNLMGLYCPGELLVRCEVFFIFMKGPCCPGELLSQVFYSGVLLFEHSNNVAEWAEEEAQEEGRA